MSIPTTNLEVWYDPASLSGLSDGDRVASWTDSSGNGRTATQSTDAYRYKYRTSLVNGHPGIEGQPADSGSALLVPNPSITTPSNWTHIFVVKQAANANHRWLWDTQTGRYIIAAHTTYTTPAGAGMVVVAGTWQYVGESITGEHVVTVVSNQEAGYTYYYVDGQLHGTTTYTTKLAWNGTAGLGCYYDGINFRQYGSFGDVLVYSRALSDTERLDAEIYLYQKYGIGPAWPLSYGTQYWTKRWDATIPAAQVGTGGVSNFSTLLYLPTSVYDYCRSDGGDLRASTDTAGTSEIAMDIIHWDYGNTAPIVRVGQVSLSDSVANNISIWAGNPYTPKPAVTDSNGQYAVYDSSWGGYWTLSESAAGGASAFKDRTVNQYHGSPGVNQTSFDLIDGKVGKAQNFDGSTGDIITADAAVAVYSPTSYSMFSWVRRTETARKFAISNGYWSSDTPVAALDLYTGTETRTLLRDDAGNAAVVAVADNNADGNWHLYAITNVAADDHRLYKDGAQIGSTAATTLGTTTLNRFTIGALSRMSTAFPLIGDVDEVHIHSVPRDLAWIKTEYNQTNDNASFATWTGPIDTSGNILPLLYYYGLLRG